MTKIGNIWYMENGPAQAEIVYFALYKLAQFPGEITEGEEYKTGLSFQPVLRIRADFFSDPDLDPDPQIRL